LLVLAAGGACLLASASVNAGDEQVRKWLDQMARAIDELDYRGTMVYFRDDGVDTLRIVHRVDEDGIRERIYSLDGKPREIVRNNDRVKCFFPDSEALVVQSQIVSRMLPELPVESLGESSEVYSFRHIGEERVAGHAARVVEIVPRDEFRYGHKYWLEEKTGMLLRSALLDAEGRILQQLTFTDIELGARIEDAELESSIGEESGSTRKAHLPDTRQPVDRQPKWAASELPMGFELHSVEQSYREGDGAFEHLVFSDGLATVSVYVERWDGEGNPVGQSMETVGPVHIFTRHQDGIQITAVGEVPAHTVQYINQQMNHVAGGRAGEPR